MKAFISLLLCLSTIHIGLQAQDKQVLIEKFSNQRCGWCPYSALLLDDSLLIKHPKAIAITLHTFNTTDSMLFPGGDSLAHTYAYGTPLAAVNRKFWPTENYVALNVRDWDNRIQEQLNEAPMFSVDIAATWDEKDQMITTTISSQALQDMPTGDYRFSLYIVEDSVTGVGFGYDQRNYFNQDSTSKLFGRGHPIEGYTHRHVARALLPSHWGQAGMISNNPKQGEVFSTTMSYQLPSFFDKNQVSLVGFVWKYDSKHQEDLIFNVDQAILKDVISQEIAAAKTLHVYPNPVSNVLCIRSKGIDELVLHTALGQEVHRSKPQTRSFEMDISFLEPGIYFISVQSGEDFISQKVVISR